MVIFLFLFFKSEIAVATPSFMFRKEYLDSVGLFNEAKPFADIDFFLRLAKQVNGVILYEPLFFRRLHDANVSSLEWEKGSREGLELLRSYKKILPPGITRNAFFKQHINFGEKYLNIKQPRKAITHFINSWKQKPFNIIPLKKAGKAILFFFKK
ncbi:MAG: hypothetical protein WDN26_04130 [Chitinophagaceae bacterium]